VRRSLPLALSLAVVGGLLSPLVASTTPAVAAVPAATDALGYDRLTLRRADTWVLQPDLDGGAATSYGEDTGGWMPVAGDTDGDGSDSLSLFRDGVWKLRDSAGGPVTVVRFGLHGDVPLLGDWNGDGVDSLGLFRHGQWFVRDVNGGPTRTFRYGLTADLPVVGDWNGDGRTDLGVVRNRTWYQRDSLGSGPVSRTFVFGNLGDKRLAGDWDHDGRDSPAVWRDGTWYLRESNAANAPYQKTFFGRTGDVPLVRRTQGLAPGVTHRVLHPGGTTVHVLTIDLAAASSVDTVLSNSALQGFELTSAMARRSGAVAAVNGDFGLSNGRPVHVFAHDGELVQTAQALGRAIGFNAGGTQVSMGYPSAGTTLTAQTATGTATMAVPRWNSGAAESSRLAGFTAVGGGLEVPPWGSCYAGLAPAGARTVHPDGGVDIPMTVSGTRCYGDAPLVPPTGVMLDGAPGFASGTFLQQLRAGQSASLTQSTGFAGAVDVLGGNPMLVINGVIKSADVDGSDGFSGPNPRTAVGQTADGRLLVVVVDGREYGYSAGMSLRQLADFMQSLGAVNAINLDGGGSSTMWLNGVIANRPSDPSERPVSSALVVLPGSDPGEAQLRFAPRTTTTAPQLQAQRAPEQPLVSPVFGGTPVPGWGAAAADPASTGGLAEHLAEQGVPLSPDLQRAQAVRR
jgi:hypothetical protein